MKHPLHENLLCHPEDLGAPIPDSPHAVSVCLPLWADVTGYEENDPRVISRMRAGYPRFFFHSQINATREKLRQDHGRPGENVLPFPDESTARECAIFIGSGARAVQAGDIWGVFFPENALTRAKAYWQHTGKILSSRAASDWLASGKLEKHDPALEDIVRSRLSGWSEVPDKFITLHPSGMAAIYTAFTMAQARRPHRRMVMFGFPYTDTLKILQKFGVGVEFYPHGDEADLQKLERLLQSEEIAGIFCEIPGNPLLQVCDLPALHKMTAAASVPLIVDDTIGTFFNIDVPPHADLVASSLTKAFSGEGDVMAGALTINPGGLFGNAHSVSQTSELYIQDLRALEINSRNFGERMKVANQNALSLAKLLDAHPAIEKVFYPGLHPSPVYETLRKPRGGYGAVLSFLPHNAPETSRHIFESLAISRGISFGTSYSLICPYVQLAHYHELEWVQSCGIDPHLLRVAVGTEPWETLRERFTKALQ